MSAKYERNFAQDTTFLGYTEKQLETELNSFIRIPRSLLTDENITINGIVLYSRLRTYSNRKYDDWCDRHFDRIAEQTGIRLDKLKKELDKLVALGLIEIKNMPKEFKSGSNKYRIRVIKDLLPVDDLSFIKMPTRLFWYPELDNKMRLLYSYIITYKDFSFSGDIYISSNKWAEKLPMDRRTISNILSLSPATKQKGMGVSIKKDFTKMSDLEEEWIHTHSIESERNQTEIENVSENEIEENISLENPIPESSSDNNNYITEIQQEIKNAWKEFLQLCESNTYSLYNRKRQEDVIITAELCKTYFEAWEDSYPDLDKYQLHHTFMKKMYTDYKLKDLDDIYIKNVNSNIFNKNNS